MLITLRIWFWIFINYNLWSTVGSRLSILKQERHRICLAKVKEKEQLALKRKALTNWKELVILYRVITRRILTSMVMW
jgi:hypothetical protein|tara:strand:+ start:599 stop:832 length:234 start_codon:yes stop_codon:yes gene_type:complete